MKLLCKVLTLRARNKTLISHQMIQKAIKKQSSSSSGSEKNRWYRHAHEIKHLYKYFRWNTSIWLMAFGGGDGDGGGVAGSERAFYQQHFICALYGNLIFNTLASIWCLLISFRSLCSTNGKCSRNKFMMNADTRGISTFQE